MNSKERTKSYPLYKFIKLCVKTCYPKIEVVGAENLPQEPALIVGNHSQMHGPISCELYFPGDRYTWCAGQMMHLKEVPAYAFQDFWSNKPKSVRWFFKGLSYVIAPFSVCVFNNAHTIGVYRDNRIISTFKTTVKRLEEGASVIIFPECYEEFDHIVHQFQENFVDIAKLYYKRSGRAVPFVPLYIAPNLKQMHIGKPIYFDPERDLATQKQAVCQYLMESISAIARSLPEHVVVPYPNIPKDQYPWNRPREES